MKRIKNNLTRSFTTRRRLPAALGLMILITVLLSPGPLDSPLALAGQGLGALPAKRRKTNKARGGPNGCETGTRT